MDPPLILILVLSLVLPCRCTLIITTYNDSKCTSPSILVPSVNLPSFTFPNSAYGTGYYGVSFAPSQWTSPPILTSSVPVQCVAYYCGLTHTSMAQLSIFQFTYLTPQGSCPYNSSDQQNYVRVNQSLVTGILGTGGDPACQVMYYVAFNQSLQITKVTTMYGTYTCSNTSSVVWNSAYSTTRGFLMPGMVLAIALILIAA